MEQLIVYGAKSIALGVCKAIRLLYPEYSPSCFLVSSLQNNPSVLDDLAVRELEEFSKSLSMEEKEDIHVLIATPEDIHPEIVVALGRHGLNHYTCIDSRTEAKLMEQYFVREQIFPSMRLLRSGTKAASLQVFMAKFYKDKQLKNKYIIRDWIYPLQVGADLTKQRVAEYTDNVGDNISCKNVNYCELTALYWMWKNKISVDDGIEYYGLFHYRRLLDITDEDIFRLKENDIDVVLPYPTIHEPDITEHHKRYIKETDWQAMLQALKELQPAYATAFDEIFAQPYLYNYNMLLAKREVLEAYCAWLFPILERTEELSIPRGSERADRYIGYLGENLLTLYFMYHKDNLKIVYTGRIMLT